MTRTSVVGEIKTVAIVESSIMQIGDARYIQARSTIFAVQRERPEFDVNELPLSQFPFFRRPIPQLSPHENVRMMKRDAVPFINVGAVKILSVSTDSILQVGSNVCMELEAKIKHMRHFLPRPTGAPAVYGKTGHAAASVASPAEFGPGAEATGNGVPNS
jgi:spore germination protein PE